MLRDRKANGASPGWRRGVTITAMLLAGILLSGIRQPGSADNEAAAQDAKTLRQKAQAAEKSLDVAQAAKAKATLRTAAKANSFDLRYAPATSTMVVGVRPSRLNADKTLQKIIGMLEKDSLGRFGLKVADIDQVLFLGFQIDEYGPALGNEPVIVLNLKQDSKATVDSVIKGLTPGDLEEKTHNGMKYQETGNGASYSPDSKTLIAGRVEMVKWLMDATKDGPGRHVWTKQFKKVANSDFVYVLDMDAMRPEIEKQTAQARNNPILAAFSPLWEETKLIVVGAGLTGGSLLDLTAVCGSEEGAKKVQQTAQSLVPLGKNMLAGAKAQMRKAPPEAQTMMADLYGFAETSLDNMKFTQEGNTARLNLEAEGESLPVIMALLLPAVQSAREAARRAQGSNNLKLIGVAFHNYADTYRKLPHSAMVGPDGKTKHSWRVAILPFIEQEALYDQYNLDEPWDSENNKKLLAKMPATYRNPSSSGNETHTSYFGLVGADTGFGDSSKDLSFRDFTDGTSNTILVVGAKREVPWTKPEDIPYDAEKDIPKFGGFHPSIFTALICDGSVRIITQNVAKKTLRALITRNGGEVIPEF